MADYLVFSVGRVGGGKNHHLLEMTGGRLRVELDKLRIIKGDVEYMDVVDIQDYANLSAAMADLRRRCHWEANDGKL